MKTAAELRKLDHKKLLAERLDLMQKLTKIRFDVENGHSKSIHLIKAYRRQVALIETILAETKAANDNQEVAQAA